MTGDTNRLGIVVDAVPVAERECAQLRQEVQRLTQWVNDLQAGSYITCVYCGHRYGPDDEVPTTMAAVLTEHVEQCPKHPMSALRQENERLRDLLRGSCRVYHEGDLDGRELQWVGVHVVRWGDHPSSPTIGFLEWDEEAIQEAIDDPTIYC